MPYFLLIFGLLIGIYGLYRFFLYANLRQISALFMTAGFLAVSAALFFLALTGRLPAALGLLLALWPVGVALWQKKKGRMGNHQAESAAAQMTRAEALDVLGLTDEATAKDIKQAYHKLMKKVHPDQEGSKWMAAKLNQARDILLR